MTAPAAIDARPFERPARLAPGKAPKLAFVPIASLRVDRAYQRGITRAGHATIRRIVADFRWSRFSPVIVAALGERAGGPDGPRLFVVIDGQHRATAAAACGFDTVPCQVIEADAAEQAAAFAAVNGVVTRMHAMQLHLAQLAAGDPAAVEIDRVARAGKCEILKYPVQIAQQAPGQTMAVASIGRAIRNFGADTVITALQCITETENNHPGAICATSIKGICEALDLMDRWREAGLVLLDVMDEFDLLSAIEAAVAAPGAGWRNLAAATAEHLRRNYHRLPGKTGAAS